MIKFPLKFEVKAVAVEGTSAQWTAQNELLPPIPCAIPPEFMGPGEGYSPEDFFAMALLNCLIATFKVYCEKAKVSFREIKGKVVLTVDKVPGQSGLAMPQADIFLDVAGASDTEQARKLLDGAIKDCAVSNSIKTGKTFHINVS
jgi:organic hydroperoxide reductase OsmC/OhrA